MKPFNFDEVGLYNFFPSYLLGYERIWGITTLDFGTLRNHTTEPI